MALNFYGTRVSEDVVEAIEASASTSQLDKIEKAAEGHLPLCVPSNKFEESTFRLVERKAKTKLREYNINFNRDWVIFTIVTVYSRIANNLLSKKIVNNEGDSVFYGDIFAIIPSIAKNDEAEKEGNINLTFQLGPFVENIVTNVKSDIPKVKKGKYLIPSNKADINDMQGIEKATVESLKAYDLIIPNEDGFIYTIVITYFETLFEVMRDIIDLTSSDDDIEAETYISMDEFVNRMKKMKSSVISLNFYDIYEFKFGKNPKKKQSASVPYFVGIVPGIRAKLRIKSDGSTED